MSNVALVHDVSGYRLMPAGAAIGTGQVKDAIPWPRFGGLLRAPTVGTAMDHDLALRFLGAWRPGQPSHAMEAVIPTPQAVIAKKTSQAD